MGSRLELQFPNHLIVMIFGAPRLGPHRQWFELGWIRTAKRRDSETLRLVFLIAINSHYTTIFLWFSYGPSYGEPLIAIQKTMLKPYHWWKEFPSRPFFCWSLHGLPMKNPWKFGWVSRCSSGFSTWCLVRCKPLPGRWDSIGSSCFDVHIYNIYKDI